MGGSIARSFASSTSSSSGALTRISLAGDALIGDVLTCGGALLCGGALAGGSLAGDSLTGVLTGNAPTGGTLTGGALTSVRDESSTVAAVTIPLAIRGPCSCSVEGSASEVGGCVNILGDADFVL